MIIRLDSVAQIKISCRNATSSQPHIDVHARSLVYVWSSYSRVSTCTYQIPVSRGGTRTQGSMINRKSNLKTTDTMTLGVNAYICVARKECKFERTK
jgi:hypothetical protein